MEKSLTIVVHVAYEHEHSLMKALINRFRKAHRQQAGDIASYTKPLLAQPRFALAALLLISCGILLPILITSDEPEQLLDGQSIMLGNSRIAQTNADSSLGHNVQNTGSLPSVMSSVDQPLASNTLAAAVEPPTTSTLPARVSTPATLVSSEVVIKPGDTLGSIFKRMDLSPQLLHTIINHDENTKNLARLNVGETLHFGLTETNNLVEIKRAAGMDQWLLVKHVDDAVSSEMIPRDMTYTQVNATGIIDGNLFNAGKQAGMTDMTIIALAKIFGWDIDFALDIRRGDRFAVIYEEIWRDGSYLRDGDIIAARFVNQGDVYDALRFDDGETTDYYSPDGKPMRKAFLRAPVDFTRISDSFNPRRLHPILKTVRPHNGIDYAAPSGTPVYAAGSGRVIRSSYSAPNGHHVFIDHANGVITKYLHFTKRNVSLHERVKQGDVIGYVGATGLATAPHLHYEFIVDGVHRNPRTVKLPSVVPLSADKLQKLQQQHRSTLRQIAALDNSMSTSRTASTAATP